MMMYSCMDEQTITQLESDALLRIQDASSLDALEQIEVELFGRKQGTVTECLKRIKDFSSQEKKTFGALMNEMKMRVQQKLVQKKSELNGAKNEKDTFDIGEPYLHALEHGTLHPVTAIQYEIEDFFKQLGFMVLDGPELETEYYNFESLNIPADHPARDMQDTFYIEGHQSFLMRTQTSPMQIRALRAYGAPLQAIVPGRCYRNEATDARHEHTFYQLEGFVVGVGIDFSHLKGIIDATAQWLYGQNAKVRLRPKYYPFVEPGVSGEVTCALCEGKGCRVCKQTGFLEIFGAGLIHPRVLSEGGCNPKKISGLAFGFGLTRLAMLKYGITDIRLLQSGNLDFLNQF